MNLKDKLIQGAYFAASIASEALSKEYSGPFENLIHGYGHDVTLPFGLYFFSRLANFPSKDNKWSNVAFVFFGCSAFEIAQGLGIYRGTFDSKDFLAYAIGTGLAVAVDKFSIKQTSR